VRTSEEERVRDGKYLDDCEALWKRTGKKPGVPNAEYDREHDRLRAEYDAGGQPRLAQEKP